MIKTIRDNLITRLSTILGEGYSKLSYTSSIEANKFNRAVRRYSVIPEASSEAQGVNNKNTFDHTFTFILTDGYVNGAENQLNDDLKMERVGELQSKALEIYKDLQANRTSISNNILIINQMAMNAVEFLDEERIAVLRFSINIKYRI